MRLFRQPSVGDWDSVFAVYTGPSVDSLTEVAASYLPELQVEVSAGTTYYIAVDGDSHDATPFGPFDLDWSIASPPNDDFAAATVAGKLDGCKASEIDPRPAGGAPAAEVGGGIAPNGVGLDRSATYRGAMPAGQPKFTDGWTALDAGDIL